MVGNIRYIFCNEQLPVSEYPFVGTILQCLDCNEFMLVHGHYLGYNESVNMADQSYHKNYLKN